MKMHKLEVYVYDFEGYGAAEYVTQIENMRHAHAKAKATETAEIGDWSDSHELNNSTTPIERFRSYFKETP